MSGCALLLLSSGCATTPPPELEFALARSALDAARSVEAGRHSPGFYHRAEKAYREARDLFYDRHYAEAARKFELARENAEKAENSARLIRFKNGEVL